MEDLEQIEGAKNKHWIGLGYIVLIIGILISIYIFEAVEHSYLGIIILGVFACIAALLLEIGNYYDGHKKDTIPGEDGQIPKQTQGEVPIEVEDEVEDDETDLFIAIGLIVVMVIFILFALHGFGLLWNETDDTPTLEVTDWSIDAHPRRFLMMDDNGSWSYEYEFNFNVWVFSESDWGGYPYTWIRVYYVVNNETIESETISITESESGSADHHHKKLITNHRVAYGDDVKIILEFPHSGFEWVDGANDFTRYSWLIVYNVDIEPTAIF